jgi:heme oxygenase
MPELKRLAVMDDLLELDEQILTFDISDEVIERAASAEQAAFTWAYCTNGAYWYDCNWPQ